MKSQLLKSFLVSSVLLSMVATGTSILRPSVASATAADRYIETAQGRLKVGRHPGVNANGNECAVTVALSGAGSDRTYTVEIDPTMSAYQAPPGPTVISFSSKDARVFFDTEGVRAVKNRADDYHVLTIEKRKSGKTFVRVYLETPGTVKIAECLF